MQFAALYPMVVLPSLKSKVIASRQFYELLDSMSFYGATGCQGVKSKIERRQPPEQIDLLLTSLQQKTAFQDSNKLGGFAWFLTPEGCETHGNAKNSHA
jgi:hypothetical protein